MDPLQISEDQITKRSLCFSVTAIFTHAPSRSAHSIILALCLDFQLELLSGDQGSSHLLWAAHSSL